MFSFSLLSTEINVLCFCDQCRVGFHEQLPTSQRKISNKGRQLFGDVVFFEIILQRFNVLNYNQHNCPNHPGVEWDKAINKSFIDLGTTIASCSWRAGMLGPCSASRGVTAVNTSYLEVVGSASNRFMTWAIASLGIAYANFFFLSIWKQFNPRGEVLFQPCNQLL